MELREKTTTQKFKFIVREIRQMITAHLVEVVVDCQNKSCIGRCIPQSEGWEDYWIDTIRHDFKEIGVRVTYSDKRVAVVEKKEQKKKSLIAETN